MSRDPVAGHLGGKGAVVAALHLMTLGVLAMAAMGAGYQLLPMATARPVRSVRGSATSFWLASPGVALFTGGLAVGVDAATHAGAALVAAGLTLFAMLTADNLRGAAAMPLVRRHVQVALVSLIATIVLGLILLVDWERGFLPDHLAAAGAHAAVAAYGFMGMLVLGFSTILVPMLALAQAPDRRLGQWVLALAAAGLVLTLLGGLAGVPLAMAGGAVLGLAAALLHITAMTRVIKRRMKKQLGPSFLLIRAGWCLLVASLMLAAALSLDLVPSPWATLLGVLLVPGWLLTSLFGFLQRIMPILAQAHLTVPGARPPLVSALTPEMPLKIHGMAHLAAVAVLTVAVVVGSEWLVRVAAVLGLVAALSFAVFAAILYRRALVCRRGG
ncbi:MAG TPA: hypothetical protein VEB64_04255 [Azospirillaceae bacterium]|nr:hypothetical protein [Azospirillaceae bacterium]